MADAGWGWLSKIGQMFDQILIDYCNPKTFLVGGETGKKGSQSIYGEHRCLIFPNIFAEIFFGDLSDIFFFLPIIWTNVGCKKCNLSIQYILPSTQKGCHMAKNGQ